MKMKTIILGLGLTITACSVMAVIVEEFHGWDELQNKSRAVVIAQCKSTPEWERYTNGILFMNPSGGLVASDMEVVSVLKGTNSPRGTRINVFSEFWPRQGENYLLMANYFDGSRCEAIEDYRVVPLGIIFTTEPLTGKKPEEQIRIMIKSRINHLTQQIQQAQAEKLRLEAALKD
jgi:hypothetical protein